MDETPAIIVNDLHKTFRLPHEQYSGAKQLFVNFFNRKRGYELQRVIDGVSFEIKKGEFFGIVGRNGSGKSTLLKLLAGIYNPDSGTVAVKGSLTPFIELGVGFNPELTGRENIYMNGALLGFSRQEMATMYDDIVSFAELDKFMDQKLKNYSSGMQVRLAFSIAIRAKGDILLLDEVLAVGDYDFQQKCFAYFQELKREKKTVILVTHDMNNIQKFCTSGLHLANGKVKAFGSVKDITHSYMEENIVRAETQSVQPSGPLVSGSGKAEVVEVLTKNAAGKAVSIFRPGEDVLIEFRYRSHIDVHAPTYGMVLSNKSGQVIFATNTLDQNIPTGNIKAGTAVTVTYKLANRFDDGEYEIAGALATENRTETLIRIEGAKTFKVRGVDRTARAPYYPEHEITIS